MNTIKRNTDTNNIINDKYVINKNNNLNINNNNEYTIDFEKMVDDLVGKRPFIAKGKYVPPNRRFDNYNK
jgi:hypothetical protein